MKKIVIVDDCDFFAQNLKEVLTSKLLGEYSIITMDTNSLSINLNNTFFDYIIFGINNNAESEYILISAIKKNYYHANILVVAQELTIEGIKTLKNLGINSVLLKPINIDQIIERLKK